MKHPKHKIKPRNWTRCDTIKTRVTDDGLYVITHFTDKNIIKVVSIKTGSIVELRDGVKSYFPNHKAHLKHIQKLAMDRVIASGYTPEGGFPNDKQG